MNVTVASITQSFITEKQLSPEELIAYVARVSNPTNQMNTETMDKLLRFLIRKKHWSPFEMVDMTVDIRTSRGIAQQILRHRSFSFQEFSQRYAEVTEFEPIELRYQADKNRQSSTDALSVDDEGYFKNRIADLLLESETLYKEMLSLKVAKECARFILPITTATRIFMKGSVRSWIHYLQQRTSKDTQLEHRMVADQINYFFGLYFPNIRKALSDEYPD